MVVRFSAWDTHDMYMNRTMELRIGEQERLFRSLAVMALINSEKLLRIRSQVHIFGSIKNTQ